MERSDAVIEPGALETCLAVLQQVSENPALIDTEERFKALVAKVHLQGKKHKKRLLRDARDKSEARMFGAGARQSRGVGPRSCYICSQRYFEGHSFYEQLCPGCAELCWGKRHQRSDLTGRVALVVGGRVKSGYQTALKLLRDGARVLVTTRFPKNAAHQFAQEPDYEEWIKRVEFRGLDLRDLPAVDRFARELQDALPHLDIYIHNAAQTVKKPLAFYRALLDAEQEPAAGALVPLVSRPFLLEAREGYTESRDWDGFFPVNLLDAHGQQVDLRPDNSWRIQLGAIEPVEMVEVFLVNSIAPLLLSNQLLPLLERSPHARRFVVFVTSMEGKFAETEKSAHHPHTNMTKAALNMLTRTVGKELGRRGVHVNCVDPGWFSDERPMPRAAEAREQEGFRPPVDCIDAAARIYDPIARGINDPAEPWQGALLKDYAPQEW